jgi:uncharacterized protein YqeY
MDQQANPQVDSSLKTRIDQDLKDALRKRDTLRLSVLRMLKSEIGYKEKEKGSKLSDDEIISVLSSSIKRRRESIEQFQKGGREDLASREKAEAEVVAVYLPEQLSREELRGIIEKAIERLKAAGPSSLGLVREEVMPQVKGRADGKLVNQMVSDELQRIADSQNTAQS